MILKGYLFGVGFALLCLALAFLLYKLGLPKQYTRKIVHILVGFEWVILGHYFGPTYHFLIVCIFFLILLALAYFLKLMPMISSSGDNSPGTVYYAVAMTGGAILQIFVPEMLLPFGIGIFCTSVGDGFAGLIGQLIKKYNPKVFKNKTLYGCIANFFFSFMSAFLLSRFYSMPLGVWQCLIIAYISTMLEIITGYGLDNITITWAVTLLTYGFMYFEGIWVYIVSIIATPIIIAFAIGRRALTRGGVAIAILVDVAITVSLGNFGFTVLAAFFILSVVIDKIKKLAKGHGEEEKGDCRDAIQVLANGLIPAVLALLCIATGRKIFAVAFVASLSEAFADTAASGLGAFAKKTFDPFRMKRIDSGLSGGMSLVGTVASACGALLIGLIPVAFGIFNMRLWLISSGAAFIGTLIDSLLGSLVQVKYRCTECGRITEKHKHCDMPTVRHSGLSFVDNDMVNLAGGITAAAFAGLLVLIT